MARASASRISVQKIVADLRLASRKGDRSALTLALDGMRTLAHSPRYWQKYLALLRNPFARLVDLLVIKQGDKIAHQKGWKLPAPASPPVSRAEPPKSRRAAPAGKRRRGVSPSATQSSLFD